MDKKWKFAADTANLLEKYEMRSGFLIMTGVIAFVASASLVSISTSHAQSTECPSEPHPFPTGDIGPNVRGVWVQNLTNDNHVLSLESGSGRSVKTRKA